MRPRVLLCVIAIFLFVSATMAQITLTAASFSTVGHVETQYSIDMATVNVGAGGANQHWTLSGYTWADTMVMDIADPATMPLTADFPTATRARHFAYSLGPMTMHEYFVERVDDGGYYELGEIAGYNTSWFSTLYSPQVHSLSLPITYGGTHTRVKITPDGDDLVEVDSSLIVVDGWGTLTTPFGTYNVLRLAAHEYVKVRTISTGYEQIVEVVNYLWIDGNGVTVATVEADGYTTNPDLTNASITMVDYTPRAVKPAYGPVATRFAVGQNYPNPFNPQTNLPIVLSKASRVTVDIYNETGQLVSHQEHELTAGAHNVNLNGAAWSTGMYFAHIGVLGQMQTTRMQLIK
jgi:hypothetical protein